MPDGRTKNTNLTAYLPIVKPLTLREEFEGVTQDTLDELCSLSGVLEVSAETHKTVKLTIEVVDSNSEDRSELEEWVEFRGRNDALMKVSAEGSVSDETIEVQSLTGEVVLWEGKRAEESDKLFTRAVFEKGLYDIAIVANIARPGSLEFGRGTLFQDDEYKCTTDKMGNVHLLREAVQVADSIGWPSLQTFDFAQVWLWASKQQGFIEGFGGGPTGRALNAFASLFQSEDETINLLWALVGIEAMYTRGQGALQEQVKAKSQAFLGKQEAHKKRIGQMYDFRSKFVHGDLDFSGRYPLRDASSEFMKYTGDLFASIELAEAILLATLQKLVELDWKGLTFSYQVSDLPE